MRVVLVVYPPHVVVVLVAVVALVVVAIADAFAVASDSVGGSGGDATLTDAPTAAEAAAKTAILDSSFVITVHSFKNLFYPFEGQWQQRRPRPVVFLQHGLKGCSADWTIGGLAYALADLGYDVWMGNFRGNYFSDRHKSFAFNDPKFWDFSFEDHGHAGENFDSFVV